MLGVYVVVCSIGFGLEGIYMDGVYYGGGL